MGNTSSIASRFSGKSHMESDTYCTQEGKTDFIIQETEEVMETSGGYEGISIAWARGGGKTRDVCKSGVTRTEVYGGGGLGGGERGS
jgi:hypothetical protein